MRSLSELTKEADQLFSLYIRRKNALNGKVKCVTCNNWFDINDIQCSHFISRDKFGVRYDEDNCNPQCEICNSAHNENRGPYVDWIITNKKPGTLSRLTRDSLRFVSSLEKRLMLENIIRDTKVKLRKL